MEVFRYRDFATCARMSLMPLSEGMASHTVGLRVFFLMLSKLVCFQKYSKNILSN